MDMKRILQALDGASTKPVEGANDMSKFLRIIEKNDVTVIREEINNNAVLNEGANPHKVTLPVQMAMQHYQPAVEKKSKSPSLLERYFQEVIQENYNPNLSPNPGFKPGAGPGVQPIDEMPIAHNPEQPHNPRVHSHQGFNSHELMTLIAMARKDLNRLADMATKAEASDDESKLIIWNQIAHDFARNGLIGTLADRVEQIRHGVEELSNARRTGKGVPASIRKQISPNIGENFNAEYDDEAGMADNNLETLKRAVQGLDDIIHPGDNLPEWCQEKIAVAKGMLVSVWDYMESEQGHGVAE